MSETGVPCFIEGALAGATAGGVAGATVGAAGGTFVVPGVGTLSGGGGGAVAGGLAGFVAGGVAGGIADLGHAADEFSKIGSRLKAWATGILIGLGGGKPDDRRDPILEGDGVRVEYPINPKAPRRDPDEEDPERGPGGSGR